MKKRSRLLRLGVIYMSSSVMSLVQSTSLLIKEILLSLNSLGLFMQRIMSSSILRRLLSHKINGSRFPSPRKFSTAAVNRELLEPSSPWLMLPPSFLGGRNDMTYNFYSPIKRKVVSFNNRGGQRETDLMRAHDTSVVGSSHGWLALYSKLSRDLFLSNPLSGRLIHLPPFSGSPFRDKEQTGPHKVIISCSPNNDDCRAIMILGSMRDRAAFCRPGRSTEWAPLGRWYDDPVSIKHLEGLRSYIDFVYSGSEKKLFGFLILSLIQQELEGWDIANPVRPRTVQLDRLGRLDLEELCSFPGTCLVAGEQPDQLFLVKQLYTREEETVDFNVYRIIEGELELCSTLDDLVMFVGINHSFAVKASKFPELKPNSIYFSDVSYYKGQYIGVFDYQNKACSTIYYPYLRNKDPKIQQPWFTPTLD